MNYFSYTLSEEDARIIVRALRQQAFHLSVESERAYNLDAYDYSEILASVAGDHNDIADFINLKLPDD